MRETESEDCISVIEIDFRSNGVLACNQKQIKANLCGIAEEQERSCK